MVVYGGFLLFVLPWRSFYCRREILSDFSSVGAADDVTIDEDDSLRDSRRHAISFNPPCVSPRVQRFRSGPVFGTILGPNLNSVTVNLGHGSVLISVSNFQL